jgi:hypothetical protein
MGFVLNLVAGGAARFAVAQGVGEFTGALIKYGPRLVGAVRRVDERAGEKIVDLARAAAPQASGRLFNGIETRREGDEIVVEASAINPGGRKGGAGEGADYARFVEFGTKPHGGRQGAEGDFFEGSSRPRSRPRRGHPGTPAQPFFYPSASEVLAERAHDLGAAASGTWGS